MQRFLAKPRQCWFLAGVTAIENALDTLTRGIVERDEEIRKLRAELAGMPAAGREWWLVRLNGQGGFDCWTCDPGPAPFRAEIVHVRELP